MECGALIHLMVLTILFRRQINPFTRKWGWYGEIVKDKVTGRVQDKGEMSPGEGFVPVAYETKEGKKDVWLPKNGLILPRKDDKKGILWFKEDTLVPVETVPFDQREIVENRFSELNIPQEQISGFFRLDDYKDIEIFVGRDFDPGNHSYGRFGVSAKRLPEHSGSGKMGSRSADESEVVMKVPEEK